MNRRYELYKCIKHTITDHSSYIIWIRRKWHQFRELKGYGTEDDFYKAKYVHANEAIMHKEFDAWLEDNADNFNPHKKEEE